MQFAFFASKSDGLYPDVAIFRLPLLVANHRSYGYLLLQCLSHIYIYVLYIYSNYAFQKAVASHCHVYLYYPKYPPGPQGFVHLGFSLSVGSPISKGYQNRERERGKDTKPNKCESELLPRFTFS